MVILYEIYNDNLMINILENFILYKIFSSNIIFYKFIYILVSYIIFYKKFFY